LAKRVWSICKTLASWAALLFIVGSVLAIGSVFVFKSLGSSPNAAATPIPSVVGADKEMWAVPGADVTFIHKLDNQVLSLGGLWEGRLALVLYGPPGRSISGSSTSPGRISQNIETAPSPISVTVTVSLKVPMDAQVSSDWTGSLSGTVGVAAPHGDTKFEVVSHDVNDLGFVLHVITQDALNQKASEVDHDGSAPSVH
jgi:hypothetical protein